jgi:hypothetical protein
LERKERVEESKRGGRKGGEEGAKRSGIGDRE